MALRPGSDKTPEDKQAELAAAQDEVLMREIDDAVRQDEFMRLVQTYGRPLLAVLVAGLVAFAGYLFWQSRQEAVMEKSSEDLIAALDQLGAGNLDSAAATAQALSGKSDGAVRASALLLQADVALRRNQPQEAARLYGQVAADQTAPAALRDLALVREASTSFDTSDPARVIDRLKPLAVPGNPWFGSAGELVAMAYLEQGKRREAGTLFGEIARAEDVPQSIRSRARQMAGLLGVDAIEDVDKLLESQGLGQSDNSQTAPAE